MVSLPLWAVFAVSFGSPALASLGVLASQWISRRTARELEMRSRREETMRTLRWAAELAIHDDPPRARLGSSQLTTLGRSTLLDSEQSLFVDAAPGALVDPMGGVVEPESSIRDTLDHAEGVLFLTEEKAREDSHDD